MDGLLIIDKPVGPTSHDVVARVRRVLGERRVGHTGTLDPMAGGVLPLVIGRATRLAQFLSADEKTYDAAVRLGISTDTYDALGQPVGAAYTGPLPTPDAIDEALRPFRGPFMQQPPAFSAKKIAGRRSYALARRGAGEAGTAAGGADAPVLPEPVRVTAYAIDVTDVSDDLVRLRVTCSAGFYIRSLAHDLGGALGTGAHLAALRRTACGSARIEQALPLERLLAADGAHAASAAMIPMDRMLPALPAVTITADAVPRVACGRDLGPLDAGEGFAEAQDAARLGPLAYVRLLDPAGRLVAVATPSTVAGLLHPAVVLL